jgi:endonuclease-8
MPEGHTLHRRARDHTRWFGGQTVRLSSPQGRFSDGASALDRCVLQEGQAVGKHLLYRFDEGWIHIHLGLFGKFRLHRNPAPEPKGAIRLRMQGEERTLDLSGPTACELYTDEHVARLRKRLGPDPLDVHEPADARRERWHTLLARRRKEIGAVLMDQAVVAGVGNVYRAELLFRAGISPYRSAQDLDHETADALWTDMVEMLALGVKYDRIITVRPEHAEKPPSKLKRAERHYVYKRKVCRVCDSDIAWSELANRKMYHCPVCQPS